MTIQTDRLPHTETLIPQSGQHAPPGVPGGQAGQMHGRTVAALAGRQNLEAAGNRLPGPGKDNVAAAILHDAGNPPARGLQRGHGVEPARPGAATLENRVVASHAFASVEEGLQQAAAERRASPQRTAAAATAGAPRDRGGQAPRLDPASPSARQASFSEAELIDVDPQPAEPAAGPAEGATTPRRTSVYWQGLTSPTAPELGRKTAALFKQHPRRGLAFLAGKVNPNKFGGIVKNLFKLLSSPRRANKALKQNCMYCAKAVDANLAELASVGKQRNAIRFYQTKMASEGTIDHVRRHPQDSQVVLDGKVNALKWLSEKIPSGNTAIITMPVKNRRFSHAMNLLHTNNGKLFVIDGQNGKTYDLDQAGDRQRFESRYCNAGKQGHPAVVDFFLTGAAPDLD